MVLTTLRLDLVSEVWRDFGTMTRDPNQFSMVNIALVERLFDHLPASPFFMKDRALRYVAANDAMLALCGVRDRAELIGRSAHDFFSPALADRYERLDRQVIETERPVRDRLDLTLRAGVQPIWLLFARWPVEDDAGNVVGVAATSRNLEAADRKSDAYERLAQVLERMQRDYGEPLRIEALARSAGLSQSNLERDFLHLFGITPRAYLAKCRIEAALSLLAQDDPIADVALACGYSDQSAFARRFHSAVGMTPTQYRGSTKTPAVNGPQGAANSA